MSNEMPPFALDMSVANLHALRDDLVTVDRLTQLGEYMVYRGYPRTAKQVLELASYIRENAIRHLIEKVGEETYKPRGGKSG